MRWHNQWSRSCKVNCWVSTMTSIEFWTVPSLASQSISWQSEGRLRANGHSELLLWRSWVRRRWRQLCAIRSVVLKMSVSTSVSWDIVRACSFAGGHPLEGCLHLLRIICRVVVVWVWCRRGCYLCPQSYLLAALSADAFVLPEGSTSHFQDFAHLCFQPGLQVPVDRDGHHQYILRRNPGCMNRIPPGLLLLPE